MFSSSVESAGNGQTHHLNSAVMDLFLRFQGCFQTQVLDGIFRRLGVDFDENEGEGEGVSPALEKWRILMFCCLSSNFMLLPVIIHYCFAERFMR